jgi:hypothetical protein
MSCTVGAVFTRDNGLIVFKNRDLTIDKINPSPTIATGGKWRYIKFGIDAVQPDRTGVWAGVNEKGVAVVGADGNCIVDARGEGYDTGERTWEAYEEVLASAGNVVDAYKIIVDAYQEKGIAGTGDIVLIADPNRALVIEYSLNVWGLQFVDRNTSCYVVRTNFFHILRHLRRAKEDDSLQFSSHRRYERALQLLSATAANSGIEDIKNLCRDHHIGRNAFSICRHGGEGEYKTQCSVVMRVSPEAILAEYVVNAFPCERDYERIQL